MSETKAAVSVSEMARTVGLSRQRFHQLRNEGVFPEPLYDPDTNRPYYDKDQQEVCLEVKRRNCGINGKPVLFYSQRSQPLLRPKTSRPSAKPKQDDHAGLLESLKSLGLVGVTSSQISDALKSKFPAGIDGKSEGEVIRAVFLHLKQQAAE